MKKERDYLDEAKEWSENQYNPGHYTGGNAPPGMTPNTYSRRLGWTYIVIPFFMLALLVLIEFRAIRDEAFFPAVLFLIIIGGFNMLLFIAGLRMLSKTKHQKMHSFSLRKRIKRILIASAIVLMVFSIAFGWGKLNEILNGGESEIIVSQNQQSNYKFYITKLEQNVYLFSESETYSITVDGKLEISCDKETFDLMGGLEEGNDKYAYKLKYEFNKTTPNIGRLLNVERFKIKN